MTETKTRPFARIIYGASGLGLRKDAELIRDLLQANAWVVEMVVLPYKPRLAQWVNWWERAKRKLPPFFAKPLHRIPVWLSARCLRRADLQVHLQNPSVRLLGAGEVNWLIPNQEWARLNQVEYLRYVDAVMCKTRVAEAIYQNYSHSVRWVGFSNRCCDRPPITATAAQRYRRFLHVGGSAIHKGTAAVVEAWRRHPNWPVLDLVVSEPSRLGPLPANVRNWSGIDDATLIKLRKACGVVMAPSEVEGFGHVLLEGMAWRGVVVTTDAPPMNELVNLDRGVLVAWGNCSPCRLGTRYFVSSQSIENAVEQVLESTLDELEEIGARAQAWALGNHRRFVTVFQEVIKKQRGG